jgi:hypothetical protein
MFNRFSLLFLLSSPIFGAVANAQTLNQQISRGATFFQPADPFDQYTKMMNAQNAQAQAEQAAAQRRFIEEQTRALQLENRRREEQALKAQAPKIPIEQPPPYMLQWLKSAHPRMHLFPDFQEVVFSQDLAISDDMIKLMAASPFAADIAYYLGAHKIEAMAIKTMSLADASQAISGIESRLMQTAKK